MKFSQNQIVDINIDNIRKKELDAILRTIEFYTKVQTIAFRSLRYKKPGKRKDSVKLVKRACAVLNPEIITDICRSILISATANFSLRMLELQNLPITADDVALLCKGLIKAKNLRFLSFENCQIGDGAVSELCSTLKKTLYIVALNLSGCGISDVGVRPVVNLLQAHALQRQGEVWMESLRYQTPNLDMMGGMQRLTLNDNPQIGNNGAKLICEALRDDKWMKAIDLQNCGLGDAAGMAWLNLLKGSKTDCLKAGNRTLGIVDLRRNKKMDRKILRDVTERVLTNSHDKHIKFKWLRALAEPANRGRASNWPQLEGVVRLDLDAPQLPDRVSTTNPSYQPRPISPTKTIFRPTFRPAGGPLIQQPLFQARSQSLPRLSSSAQPPHPAPRLARPANQRASRSATTSAQSTPWKVGLTRVTSVYLGGGDESNFNNGLQGDSVIAPGIPWRTAARARRNNDTTANTEASLRIASSLLNTLNEVDLVNTEKRCKNSSPMTSSSSRKSSLPSTWNASVLESRRQSKHSTHKPPCSRKSSRKRALTFGELYSRLSATLAELQRIVQELTSESTAPKMNSSRFDKEQLIVIQCALQGMLKQLGISQVDRTASSKAALEHTSSFFYSKSTRNVESNYKRPNPRPKPRAAHRPSQHSRFGTKGSSSSELFIAKPGKAIDAALKDCRTIQSQPKTRIRSDAASVRTLRNAKSAPSLYKCYLPMQSKAMKDCIDLFEDLGNWRFGEDDVLTPRQTGSAATGQYGDTWEGETLLSDF